MLQQSQESHGSSGKSAHDNLDIGTHYNVIKDVYVPEELKRPHTDVNTVSMEQQGNDYIRPNTDLETRPQIRSKEQLRYMYPECFDGIGEFKIFEYHIELLYNIIILLTQHILFYFNFIIFILFW